ncbi:MAG: transglutaminase domain-containing protein [Lachnospiraceae bacterium]|nr:transglutaminase domain-containing protein [Lachnospiraceae bacterium]
MRNYGRFGYEFILAFPLTIAFLLISPTDIGFARIGFGTVFYAALCCVAAACIRYLKGRDRLIALGAVAAFLGLPILSGVLGEGFEYFFTHLSFWIVPAITAGCFLAAMLCKRFRAARILVMLIIAAVLIALLIFEIVVPKICVMLFLSVLLLLFADGTQLRWHKSGHTEHSLHIAYITPFVILWLFICLIFPVGKEPYDWRLFRNLWKGLSDFAISLTQRSGGPSDDFDSFRPGFTANPHVHGGETGDDDRVLLHVEPLYGTVPYLRLAGQYCDTFENLTWKSTITEDNDEISFDTLETRCAFYKAEVLSDYMQSSEIRITYRKFNTRHLFVPDKINLDSEMDIAKLDVKENGRNLVYGKKHGVNNSYVVSGYRMNVMHSAFAEFVSDYEDFTEEDWQRTMNRTDRGSDVLTFRSLQAYRRLMREEYLLPVTLPDSAVSFVEQVTAGETRPFQRMVLITRALSQFAYTTAPDVFPEYVKDATSFLDYFLSTQRGYCTHFATTMVLLARSEGLPARYVHGFCVSMNGMEPVDVTADMAHAWCEIYFEGIGWIPFDATPGYGGAEAWLTRDEYINSPGGQPAQIPTVKPPQPVTPSVPQEEGGIPRSVIMVGMGLGALLLFTAFVLLTDRVITLRRFRRLPVRDRVAVLYRRNLRVLSYLRLPQEKDETLSEYRARIAADLPEGAADWIGDYETLLYGTGAEASEIAERMASGNARLVAEFKRRRPRFYRLCSIGNRLIH